MTVTSTDWCQRWTGRRTSWVQAGLLFAPARYEVAELAETDAKSFVVEHHYAGSFPAALCSYGMREVADGRLVGVAVLGVPVSRAVLSNAFPSLEPYRESCELSRLVLLDEVPGNAESWFVARVFAAARDRGFRGVVSFSDPVPRTAVDGTVVLRGHVGCVYQSLNAVYAGRSTARTLRLLPDGTVLNDRMLQKIRGQERGHRYAEGRLVDAGALPLESGDDPSRWLAGAMVAAGIRRLRHAGAHRYLFPIGTPADRRRIRLGLTADGPYPKRVDLVA